MATQVEKYDHPEYPKYKLRILKNEKNNMYAYAYQDIRIRVNGERISPAIYPSIEDAKDACLKKVEQFSKNSGLSNRKADKKSKSTQEVEIVEKWSSINGGDSDERAGDD